MQNYIRAIRKEQGLTLADLAERCDPPTTAQTIGRLETGVRTLSLGWLERIAAALDVDSDTLLARQNDPVADLVAIIDGEGARTPSRLEAIAPARLSEGQLVMRMDISIGEYRAGDQLWLDRLDKDAFANALNRDVLCPRPAGRFIFGRLLALEEDKMQILPLVANARQQIINAPEWLGVATHLSRTL
ncbi:helix-turn-helix domain-containing protein [Alterisphingorhabdus coralli]|uniref:Helix-turn-helix transcriptional regulator n=1 Tax=Alterisphingorhabdus coralli TaxID=3071408 RepID=A0AA97F4P4_9SPHN|nr:helix-turn-helix transcriptional regulator [Parasphingorhabdus sp. SCSIO 66989]WOE74279.1 helix-turn-helix transcriptional regulator [Parasphingorhabdus sp. SCSIO 66989]